MTVAQTPATRTTARSSARDLAQIAVFAALIAALTLPGAIPIGIGVPITLQTLGVMLAGAILGARKGALAVTVYVALGLAGLPILSGGTGGLGVLVGPTGGYLLGFILGAYVIGWLAERLTPRLKFWTLLIATSVGGILAVYLVGIPWRAACRSSSATRSRRSSPRSSPRACIVPGRDSSPSGRGRGAATVRSRRPLGPRRHRPRRRRPTPDERDRLRARHAPLRRR